MRDEDMHIDVTRLKSGIDTFIYFNNEVLYDKELAKNTDLIDLKDTKIEGKITKDTLGNFYLDCKLDGIMILPCAITLNLLIIIFQLKLQEILKIYMKKLIKI